MRKCWKVLMLIFLIYPTLLFPVKDSSESFLENVFIYLLAGKAHLVPPDDFSLEMGRGSGDSFSTAIGLGYRFIDIRRRVYVNLEGFYSNSLFPVDAITKKQEMDIWGVLFTVETPFISRYKLILYGGSGIAFLNIKDLSYRKSNGEFTYSGDHILSALVLESGIKYAFSHKLLARAGFRWMVEVSVEYDDSYSSTYSVSWDDGWNDTSWTSLLSYLYIGIEYHF